MIDIYSFFGKIAEFFGLAPKRPDEYKTDSMRAMRLLTRIRRLYDHMEHMQNELKVIQYKSGGLVIDNYPYVDRYYYLLEELKNSQIKIDEWQDDLEYLVRKWTI